MKVESSPTTELDEAVFLKTKTYIHKKTIQFNWNKTQRSPIKNQKKVWKMVKFVEKKNGKLYGIVHSFRCKKHDIAMENNQKYLEIQLMADRFLLKMKV